jgi:hypothetical protein
MKKLMNKPNLICEFLVFAHGRNKVIIEIRSYVWEDSSSQYLSTLDSSTCFKTSILAPNNKTHVVDNYIA